MADLKHLHQQAQKQRANAESKPIPTRRSTLDAAPPPDPLAFRRAMQTVTPLRTALRAIHAPAPADSPPAARRAAALGETPARADLGISDGGEITHLLSESGTAFVRHDTAPDTARNLRRGQWRAGAELDLHGLRVEQARHALLSFLDECLAHHIRCIRVVHGKGYGSQGLEPVLKDKVRTWLVQKAEVQAFSEAPEREGGAGAMLILLRQTEGSRK